MRKVRGNFVVRGGDKRVRVGGNLKNFGLGGHTLIGGVYPLMGMVPQSIHTLILDSPGEIHC